MLETTLVDGVTIELVKDTADAVADKIRKAGCVPQDDAFYVCDLGKLIERYNLWTTFLPRVKPFYTVNCNDDYAVLSILGQLGTGFACSNKFDVEKVIEMKVAPSSILYTGPSMQASHVKYLATSDVMLVMIDSEAELIKVKAIHPHARLVLQVVAGSACEPLQAGCTMRRVPALLNAAQQLGLNVVGVSFTNVSLGEVLSVVDLLECARLVFDEAQQAGFQLHLLDIGRAFDHVGVEIAFEMVCAALQSALDVYFPEGCDVDIIAECGEFLVESAFTFSTNIIAKQLMQTNYTVQNLVESRPRLASSDSPSLVYYLSDGVYGSFSHLLTLDQTINHLHPAIADPDRLLTEPLYVSRLLGPTCDDLDCVVPRVILPALEVGDWIIFRNMGAYTTTSRTRNAPRHRCHYVIDEVHWLKSCAEKSGGGTSELEIEMTDILDDWLQCLQL